MKISAKVGASTRLYMKKFLKSQQDPNPSRQVNLGLKKGYLARRVDLGWLLQSCKHLLQIDCTRVDPLRQVEANLRSYKGGPKFTIRYENFVIILCSSFLDVQVHITR